MNKFRLVGQYDETQEYKCLNCRQHLSIGYETDIYNFKCCPLCLVKWEGELIEKVNPRYKVPSKEFSKKSFRVEFRDVGRGWFPYTNCVFGLGTINPQAKSAARYAYDAFYRYISSHVHVSTEARLVLCDGVNKKVLMYKKLEPAHNIQVLEDHYFCACSG